jgi:hypothetical protein
MDDKIQEELFNEAKLLFGNNSYITSALQNPGCIKNQDDAENLLTKTYGEVKKKEIELRIFNDKVSEFRNKFREACINGKIYN